MNGANKQTPTAGLWSVIRGKSAPSLLQLIKDGADINALGGGEQSPLHLACELDAGECVKVLIANGADHRAEDGQLRTPLLLACESAAAGSAALLMDAGAFLGATDKNDMTPLHWLSHHGCAEALTQALRKGADVNAADASMRTPLWHAISKGRLSCAMLLLDAGASVTQVDDENRSPLHLTMQHCGGLADSKTSVPLLERLLQLKMDVNAVDREKRTALHWACANNALPCVDGLIAAKADVDARDCTGLAPMHCACPLDAVDSVRALLKAGAHAEATDRDKRTPLHWAADRAAEATMKELLQDDSTKVDTTDWNGFSALHYAARRSAVSCVRLLIDHGADRSLVAANGEVAEDLATDDDIRRMLKQPGLKRKRSLSSTNSLALEQELPSLAEKLFQACSAGDTSQFKKLCTPELWTSVKQEVEQLCKSKSSMALGQVHACSRTLTTCVELKMNGKAAVQLLTFNQDGLATAFKHFAKA
jgi:ankyrin repeat protein